MFANNFALFLFDHGSIDKNQLDEIITHHNETDEKLGQIVLKKRILTKKEIFSELIKFSCESE